MWNGRPDQRALHDRHRAGMVGPRTAVGQPGTHPIPGDGLGGAVADGPGPPDLAHAQDPVGVAGL